MLVYFLLMCIPIILCYAFYLKTRVSYNNKLYLYYKGMYNVQLEECSKVIEAKNKYEDDLLNANLSWEEKYTELIKTCDCLDNDIKQEKINSSILTEKLEASGFQIDDLKREKELLIKEIENLKKINQEVESSLIRQINALKTDNTIIDNENGELRKKMNELWVDLNNSNDTSKLLFKERTTIEEELEKHYQYKACLREICETIKECLKD